MTQLIVGAYGTSQDVPQNNMLGLPALLAELRSQDVGVEGLLEGTALSLAQMQDANTRISHRQKVTIFANMQRLMRHPDSGLRAGERQRISDFGIFGYALLSSEHFGQAVDFGIRHIRLLGPVFEKTFRVEGNEGIFVGQGLAVSRNKCNSQLIFLSILITKLNAIPSPKHRYHLASERT